MGSSHSVELFEEQDSFSEVGKTSVISASLDVLDPPVSDKDFIEEFLNLVKYPVDPVTEAVLKSVEVKDISADEFIVKVTLDGKKLDGYGYGRGDGSDRIRTWKRVTVDRSKCCLTTYDFVQDNQSGAWADEASDSKELNKCAFYVLSDPTRLEFCYDDQDGVRQSSAPVRDSLYGWTDPIINGVQDSLKAKVKVRASGPSVQDPGMTSNVSEPMDEHVDFENFFLSMVKIHKQNLAEIPNSEMVDLSETEFVSSSKMAGVEEGTEKLTRNVVKFHQETGDMTCEIFQDDKFARKTFYKVHRAPLVVEYWGIDVAGDRVTGDASARQLQKLVNAAIEKANSWFG